MTAILDPGAAGTSCIGLLLDTDYFARAEACLIETNGSFSAELRITEGDHLAVTTGGLIASGPDLELGLIKTGPDFYLTLNDSPVASDNSTGSRGDVHLRPFVSAESCTEDPGPVALGVEDFAVLFAPEPTQMVQWLAGLSGLLLLRSRRASRKSARAASIACVPGPA